MHYSGLSNGISNANGVIVLNGNSAVVRNLSAEIGGGTINATGFVGYSSRLRFGLRASASKVRLQVQPGASVVTAADIHLTGTTERSMVSGSVTIDSINYQPQSDIGAILSGPLRRYRRQPHLPRCSTTCGSTSESALRRP